MKRYEVITGTNFGKDVYAEESPDGEWVKFADVSTLTVQDMSKAMLDVAAERVRQVEVEGFDAEHDDAYNYDGEIAAAAACYANPMFLKIGDEEDNDIPLGWPNSCSFDFNYWYKPSDRRRNMVKAAALLIAEIERLDRANPAEVDDHET